MLLLLLLLLLQRKTDGNRRRRGAAADDRRVESISFAPVAWVTRSGSQTSCGMFLSSTGENVCMQNEKLHELLLESAGCTIFIHVQVIPLYL
jgi:hypothetical protein